MDLAFVFGTSPGSLASERFEAQKELVNGILRKYDISKRKALVSFILKDTQPVLRLKLGEVTSKENVAVKIASLRNRKQTVPMASLLAFINNTVFSVRNGARLGVPKSILYFVDNKDPGSHYEISKIAAKLKEDKVKLVFVAQGDSVDTDKLDLLTPRKPSVFSPMDLKTINKFIIPIAGALKPGMLAYLELILTELGCSCFDMYLIALLLLCNLFFMFIARTLQTYSKASQMKFLLNFLIFVIAHFLAAVSSKSILSDVNL